MGLIVCLGLIFAVAVVSLALSTTWPDCGLPTIAGVFILVVCLVPRTLKPILSSGSQLFDIAPAAVSFTSYGIVLVGVLIALLLGGYRLSIPGSLSLFLLVALFMMFSVWDGNVHQWSGYITLVLAAAGWAVGRLMGGDIYSKARASRLLTGVAAIVLAFETFICGLQAAGYKLPPKLAGTDQGLERYGGRVFGTFGNPPDLGKYALLSTLLIIPFTMSRDRKTRRNAWIVLVLGAVVGTMTISRADLVAQFVLVAGWIIWMPGRRRVGTKILAFTAVGLGLFVALPKVLERFSIDPNGGSRPELLKTAMHQIGQNHWAGTGPNSYVDVVSSYDQRAAAGYPVHNTFLLAVAEFGLPCAVLLGIPLVVLAIQAVRRIRHGASPLDSGRALTFAIPGLFVIYYTGWGMLGTSRILMSFMIYGVFDAAFRLRDQQPEYRDTTVTAPAPKYTPSAEALARSGRWLAELDLRQMRLLLLRGGTSMGPSYRVQ